MRKVRLPFAADVEVEFCDRVRALQQVEELARKGTRYPVVVFGPEGCGKSAWLKQSAEVLRGVDYDVIYVDPLHKEFVTYTEVRDVVRKLAEATAEVIGVAEVKLATLAIDVVKELLNLRRRVAVLVDEAFQVVGLGKAGIYVKSLLNLIEYPPKSYERIVAITATSEGLSRVEIGRHRWAELTPMWNMGRGGFEELYEQLRGGSSIPSLEDVWRITGGNPDVLARLYQAEWDADRVVARLVKVKNLTPNFIKKWGSLLEAALENPDSLWSADASKELIDELVARNLIVYNMYDRDSWFWIDQPPPEKDLELGIGKYVAWQTPLHREAVKKALKEYK